MNGIWVTRRTIDVPGLGPVNFQALVVPVHTQQPCPGCNGRREINPDSFWGAKACPVCIDLNRAVARTIDEHPTSGTRAWR